MSNLSQIVFTDETSIYVRTQLFISESVVRPVVLACRHITYILLKVMVNFPVSGNIINDMEKPSRPIQLIRVVTFEELPVEKRNKGIHCLFRRFPFKRTPSIEGPCFSADLPFHLLNRGISQADRFPWHLYPRKSKAFPGAYIRSLSRLGWSRYFCRKALSSAI